MTATKTDRVGGDTLHIDNLYFSYNGKLPIFNGLDIEVKPGEFLSLKILQR